MSASPLGTNLKKAFLASASITLLAHSALAVDAFFHIPVPSLTFTEGALPTGSAPRKFDLQLFPAFQPYAALDGEGEVFIGGETLMPWSPPERLYSNSILAARAPKGKEVTGRLFVPKPDFSGMAILRFKLGSDAEKPDSKAEFLKAKEGYYRRLRDRDIPGAAWFRHQENEVLKASGTNIAGRATPVPGFNRRRRPDFGDYDSTYELFSGGRAVSENLQLDRVLTPAKAGEATVEITNLTGITVREMDWKSLVKELKPKTDALAAFIPFDQHALFFPSFQAMAQWIDEADADGTPVLQLFEPRAEDANTRGRYQKQLCLELNDLSRLLGPTVINSAACTGSDPFLRTGTDLAVLYETKSPGLLKTFILAKYAAMQQTNSTVKAVKGEIEGVAYDGVVSPDRTVSSYLAALEDAVLVANSRYQLSCLLQTAKGKKPALTTQDEYVFFRSRYPKGDKDETAFLVLSDATIRRWCSPQWRIADSRRTRAAAALAELQAARLEELAGGKVKPGVIESEAGEIQLTATGVMSATYGTLDFLTPIAEMPLAKVTQAEADAYKRWRDGYQQNWRQYFDPISARFSLTPQRLGAELTVMPLIAGTDYRQFIAVTRGSGIAPNSGDPHPEALLHLAAAINPQSEPIQDAGNFLGNFSPSLHASPLGWLGQSIAIYVDQDPFWEALAKAEKASDFLEKNYPKLPVALHCEVKNPLGLATFLAALRAYVEQTAPRMTTWQNLEYKDQPYVKVTSTEMEGEGGPTNLCVYYAVTPKSLVLTLSETLLKRALDRQAGAKSAQVDVKPASTAVKPWLGTNLCLQVAARFVPALELLFRETYQSRQQLLAWNNLPILNEWKCLWPEQDPVKVHEQFWQTKLVCPGGGSYVWNEKWHTMESTVYGHPGEPKPGPQKIQALANITGANLGISFEEQGLSAMAALEREAAKR
jgi:hypothetical protein